LTYDRKRKVLAFAEGLRKAFVNPVVRGEPTKKDGKTKKSASPKPEDKGGGDDFFKAFGNF
jgi:hypothetical protein